MGAQAEGAGLFVVFFLSLYTIVLVPYTIYKLCNLSEDKQVVKPWAKVSPCCSVWHADAQAGQARLQMGLTGRVTRREARGKHG
jgi:hypothetical protein